jgi:hypothetical protein
MDESFDPFGLLPDATLHLRGHLTKVENPDWKEMRLFHSDPTRSETQFLVPPATRMVLDAIEDPASTLAAVGMNRPV